MFINSNLDVELEMIDLNCRSLAHLTHHFGQKLAHRGRGGIVLMSSLVAFQGVPRAANYAATKAYVQSLSESIQRELRQSGVDVLAVAPGPVKSGFGARANMNMSTALVV
jgi:short-subunit dehydrogenase